MRERIVTDIDRLVSLHQDLDKIEEPLDQIALVEEAQVHHHVVEVRVPLLLLRLLGLGRVAEFNDGLQVCLLQQAEIVVVAGHVPVADVRVQLVDRALDPPQPVAVGYHGALLIQVWIAQPQDLDLAGVFPFRLHVELVIDFLVIENIDEALVVGDAVPVPHGDALAIVSQAGAGNEHGQALGVLALELHSPVVPRIQNISACGVAKMPVRPRLPQRFARLFEIAKEVLVFEIVERKLDFPQVALSPS